MSNKEDNIWMKKEKKCSWNKETWEIKRIKRAALRVSEFDPININVKYLLAMDLRIFI